MVKSTCCTILRYTVWNPASSSHAGCFVCAWTIGVETGGWHLTDIHPSLEDVVPQVQKNSASKE